MAVPSLRKDSRLMFFLTHMPLPNFVKEHKDFGFFDALRMGDMERGQAGGIFNRELIPDRSWSILVFATGWYGG